MNSHLRRAQRFCKTVEVFFFSNFAVSIRQSVSIFRLFGSCCRSGFYVCYVCLSFFPLWKLCHSLLDQLLLGSGETVDPSWPRWSPSVSHYQQICRDTDGVWYSKGGSWVSLHVLTSRIIYSTDKTKAEHTCHVSNRSKGIFLYVYRKASAAADGVTVEEREARRQSDLSKNLSETEPDKCTEREMKTRWRRKK